jgi:RNA polymerase sigma-70 factor (ECF subfamily)
MDTSPRSETGEVPAVELDFDHIYDRWFDEVARWVRSLGGPLADAEDVTQEVFVVVRRQLSRFDGANLGGWLYRITARTVSSHRRRAWVRRVMLRRPDVALEEIAESGSTPAELLEQKEARRAFYRLADRLNEKHRTPFILFEVEGYSGDEIAELLGITVATVWTRLHRARQQFFAALSRAKREEP